jgi:hypothetical protein
MDVRNTLKVPKDLEGKGDIEFNMDFESDEGEEGEDGVEGEEYEEEN